MARGSAIASVRFIGDASSAVAATNKVESAVTRIGGMLKGAAIATGLSVIAKKLFDVGKAGITAASDLEQSVGGVGAVFKEASGQMAELSKAAAVNVGLTSNDFNVLATKIGSQLKNGGTSIDQLAGKTNDLIRVGADLSAQFGGSTQEAVDSLSSALRGERDPIEKYGISLTQAAVDAEAAALGFTKVGGTLSTQANQAATLSLIMKQSADATGAFARETGTLAHQQQVWSANIGNLQAKIGTLFLPVLTKLYTLGNDKLIPFLDRAVTATQTFVDALRTGEGPAWMQPAISLINTFKSNIADADTTLQGVSTTLQGIGAPQWIVTTVDLLDSFTYGLSEGNGILASLKLSLESIQAPTWVTGMVAGLQSMTANLGASGGGWAALKNGVAGAYAAVQPFLPLAAGIGASLGLLALKTAPVGAAFTKLGPIFTGAAFGKGGAGLLGTLKGAFPIFGKIGGAVTKLGGVLRFLTGPIGLVVTALTIAVTTSPAFRDALLGLLGSVGSLAGTLISQLVPVVTNLATTLFPVMAQVGGVLVTAISQIATAVAPVIGILAAQLVPIITQLVSSVLPPVVTLFNAVVGAVLPLVATLIGSLVPVIVQIASAVMPALIGILGAILPVIPPVVSVIGTLVSILVAVLVPAIQVVSAIVAAVFPVIVGIIQSAIGVITGIITFFVGVFTGNWSMALDGAKQAVSSGLSYIKGIFVDLPGAILGALSGLGSMLSGVGGNMVDGLLGGLGDIAGKLKDKLLGGITSAVSSVKSFLGIQSPSRLMRRIGGFTGQGFTLGIDKTIPKAQDALTKLVAPPDAKIPKLRGSRGGAGSLRQRAQTVIQITIQGAVDKLATAREIKKLLEDYDVLVGVNG